MSRSLIESQIRAIKTQLKALRAQLQQENESAPAKPVRTLGDLRGIFKGKVRSTEPQIREAQIQWEWEEEDNYQQ